MNARDLIHLTYCVPVHSAIVYFLSPGKIHSTFRSAVTPETVTMRRGRRKRRKKKRTLMIMTGRSVRTEPTATGDNI